MEVDPADPAEDPDPAGETVPTVARPGLSAGLGYPQTGMVDLFGDGSGARLRYRGLPDDEATLERALNLIMATQPELLKRAEQECASGF